MTRSYKEEMANFAFRTVLSDTVGTYRVLVCPDCGMPVARDYTEAHDSFHEGIQEVRDVLFNMGKL